MGKKEGNETVTGIKRGSSGLAFSLVVTMLVILLILITITLYLPYVKSDNPTELTEYYKWSLSVLLGAFGAWIGAGAAYFFGKENLKESSESTEKAMKIQQEAFQRRRNIDQIKDMNLVAMNANFIFNFNHSKSVVTDKLKANKGYWFIPVVDVNTGVLQDIIHASIFWDPNIDDATKLSEIVTEMDKKPETKVLHGESFFLKITTEDNISDVYNKMAQIGVEVGIVVDQKGKATHCLTKTELGTFLKSNR